LSLHLDPAGGAEQTIALGAAEAQDGKTVDWMEHVGDEQYRA